MDFMYNLGATGSADLAMVIERCADGYLYDYDDSTFKASGWTDVDLTMSEIDSTNLPGAYEATTAEAAWDDGRYRAHCVYATTMVYGTAEGYVINGVWGSSNDLLAQIIDGSITLEQVLQIVFSQLGNDVAKSADTYTFKNQAGSTVLTEVIAADSITRTIA